MYILTKSAATRMTSRIGLVAATMLVAAGSAAAQSTPSGVPYPYPVSPPMPPITTGTWTFGDGASPTVSVTFPELDPKLGRILSISLGGGTNYAALNASVTTGDAQLTGGRIATATDTIKVSGGGLASQHSTDVFFSCLSPPCVGSYQYRNAPQTFGNSTPFVTLPVNSGPAIGDTYGTQTATEFVNANRQYYNAVTATLSSSTSVANQLGSVSGYSVTGQYSISYSRPIAPWTTGDIVHGTITPSVPQLGNFIVHPTPQLGFTADEAAHLSQYDNFNYVQTYTQSGRIALPTGTINFPKGLPTITTQNLGEWHTSGPLFNGQSASDPRVIGSVDPLPGGNPVSAGGVTRLADNFDLYWNQVPSTGAPGQPVQALYSTKNNGLDFEDRPDLGVTGRWLAFKTSLVGVVHGKEANYDTLSTVFGDKSLTFNWVWLQIAQGPGCSDAQASQSCGITISTAAPISSDPPLGISFFLGYGDIPDDVLQSRILADLNSAGSYLPVASGVPEPSTWAMMLIGFGGLLIMARRRTTSQSGMV